jgi:hypothetical protein
MKTRGLCRAVTVCAALISLGAQISRGHAQELRGPALAAVSRVDSAQARRPSNENSSSTLSPESRSAPRARGQYYVDFRARTAASYGHAFVWYGRSDNPRVEVAGLHPATDNPIPYVLGHLVPVPAETGASYGDLDEQYITAHYRVFLSEPDAKKVFAYIRHLQSMSFVWHAPTYNCQTFIGLIASYMGLKTPMPGIYPEDYVNELRKLNGGRKMAHLDLRG